MIIRSSFLILAILLSACNTAGNEESMTEVPEVPSEAWSFHDVTPHDDGVLNILALHVIEEYPGGQELLASDMNAVIDGLFEGERKLVAGSLEEEDAPEEEVPVRIYHGLNSADANTWSTTS